MYKREEAAQLRQAFWTTFGQYIAPHPSSEGLRVNWLNYNTRLKHVYFRMHADQKTASIRIEITHPDLEVQELFFEQFVTLKSFLHSCLEEDWEWLLHIPEENGKIISRICKTQSPVNIFNREDWPELISFLKPRIVALDAFWTDARYSFDWLKNG
ncbi:MAG TPA: DUF4268 domain-containing protein [Cytophagales bacterium]|nr:DUF4268 domain-containing protein [Cytophagales bacterium]